MQNSHPVKQSDLIGVLDRITSRLVQSSDPRALYDAVVDIAMETTGAQASSLYLESLADENHQVPETILMVAGAGYEVHRIGKAVYKKGQGLTGWIWQESKPVKFDTKKELENLKGPWEGVYNDIVKEKDPNWECWSLIGVPLRLGERTIGVLKAENKEPRPSHFTTRDFVVLEIIASTIALAIENQRISEKAFSSILNALYEVSEMLVSDEFMPFSTLCDRITKKCIQIFNAQACSLYLEKPNLDGTAPDTITMVAGEGYEKYRIGKAAYLRGQGLTGFIWEQGESVKFDKNEDLQSASGPWKGNYDHIIRAIDPDWVCSSLIGVPLRIGKRTIGVLKVENKNPSPQAHFSHQELRTLEILASNIALALEMISHHQKIFWEGERGRKFAHDMSNKVRHPFAEVRKTLRILRKLPQSNPIIEAIGNLSIAETTLEKIEQERKRTLIGEPSEYHRVTILIQDLISDVESRIKNILEEYEIKLLINISKEPIYVNIDREQMLKALDNLIINSIEAMTFINDSKLLIEVDYPTTATGEVEISIIDNGPGLTEAQILQFNSERSILSTKQPRIGAGLAEANRCCKDNGGILKYFLPKNYESGSGFKILLPICIPGKLKLLFIDDDDEFIKSLHNVLRNRTDVVGTYEITADSLLSQDIGDREKLSFYDWVLLDCSLKGGLDGVQIYLELLREDKEIAEKILLMSGYEKYLEKRDIKIYDKYNNILENMDTFIASLQGMRKS